MRKCNAPAKISHGNQGTPRLAGAIHGVGNVVGSLFPIGYEEESSIGQAMALQVVARYGGVVDQPELVRYVNLVARAGQHLGSAGHSLPRGDSEHDSINALPLRPATSS